MKKFLIIIAVTGCIAASILSCVPALRADEKEWISLTDKGEELYKTGHHEEAVAVARQALKAGEETFGAGHLNVVGSLDDLATYLRATGAIDEPDALYKRALAILEKNLPPDDSYYAIFLEYLSGVYEKLGKPDEAAKYMERAREARRKRAKREAEGRAK